MCIMTVLPSEKQPVDLCTSGLIQLATYEYLKTGHLEAAKHRLSIIVSRRDQVLEIRVHGDEGFLAAANVLDGPMAPEEEIGLTLDSYARVTVIREKVESGPTIAITTAEPLLLREGHTNFVLMVFDEGFRLTSDEVGAQ